MLKLAIFELIIHYCTLNNTEIFLKIYIQIKHIQINETLLFYDLATQTMFRNILQCQVLTICYKFACGSTESLTKVLILGFFDNLLKIDVSPEVLLAGIEGFFSISISNPSSSFLFRNSLPALDDVDTSSDTLIAIPHL